MRNKGLFILFIFLLFLGIAKAENCAVTSGTGKDFGDEIKCGTESFYVIDYNENTTKMLAKYNLNVGDTIDYLEVDDPTLKNIPYNEYMTIGYKEEVVQYCINRGKSKGYNAYYAIVFDNRKGNSPSNYTFDVTGCRIYEKIEYEHVRQDEKAIGTTFKSDGISYYPQVGITYMNEHWGYDYIHDNIEYHNNYIGSISLTEYCENATTPQAACYMHNEDPSQAIYGDLKLEGSSFEKYIKGYKDELERQNINFNDVDFLHLSGFKDIYKKITNEDLYLIFAYEGYLKDGEENVDYHASGKLSLIDKIPEKYKWLYATTFWLGSGSLWETEIQDNYDVSEYNDYYFTTEGILCSLGRGTCQYTNIPIGGGVRPVVTINNEYIKPAKSESTSEKEEQKEEPNPKTKDIAIFIIFIIFIISVTFILINERKLGGIK